MSEYCLGVAFVFERSDVQLSIILLVEDCLVITKEGKVKFTVVKCKLD